MTFFFFFFPFSRCFALLWLGLMPRKLFPFLIFIPHASPAVIVFLREKNKIKLLSQFGRDGVSTADDWCPGRNVNCGWIWSCLGAVCIGAGLTPRFPLALSILFQAWRRYDTDRSGYIEANELKVWCRGGGECSEHLFEQVGIIYNQIYKSPSIIHSSDACLFSFFLSPFLHPYSNAHDQNHL